MRGRSLLAIDAGAKGLNLVWCCVFYQGSEASVVVEVKQLHRYPVDLYYLVDVSASMQENLDHVSVDV